MKTLRIAAIAAAALFLLSGCAATGGYKDALVRFGETGEAIQPFLQPAKDASEQALFDAFDAAVHEALKAGD